MTAMTVKPDCFEQPEHYNVNNGICSNCEHGIECAQNFMQHLMVSMSDAIKENYITLQD